MVNGFDRLPGWKLLGCGAYFAYVEHPFSLPSPQIAKRLVAEAGVLMLPGTMFMPDDDPAGQRQFRIAFANVDTPGIAEPARSACRLALLTFTRPCSAIGGWKALNTSGRSSFREPCTMSTPLRRKTWKYSGLGGAVFGHAGSWRIWRDQFLGQLRPNLAGLGDRPIEVRSYARTLGREIDRLSRQQIGQPVGLEQAQALGIDRKVLSQLVSAVTLENEALQNSAFRWVTRRSVKRSCPHRPCTGWTANSAATLTNAQFLTQQAGMS